MVGEQDDSPINFVETIYHSLSPFSPHRITYQGEDYITLEHAYQASKFKNGSEREEIVQARNPLAAWKLAQKHKQHKALLKDDFDKLAVMEELMRLKLEQHEEVREALLATGERGLLKVYPTDYFWGTGKDGSGRNEMGLLWMRLREELQR